MDIYSDNRIVLTLDAGGTNFVFGAMQSGKELIAPFSSPSNAHDLNSCLQTIVEGFEKVKDLLNEAPSAISFAFPGPSDYERGIIGDLPNLPAFRGGIALGPMLEKRFNVPVFIQNDGDLFTYGEAMGGVLPEINATLTQKGIHKHYKNLVGLTLGTGFGAGIVGNNVLYKGDNCVPGEVWNISNSISPERNAEEGVSTRAIINDYRALSGDSNTDIMPFDIYQIAKGTKEGDSKAAEQAFINFGRHIGDAVSNLIMLFDALVVVGGGITGASDLYMPSVMQVLKGKFDNGSPRLVHHVFNLDDEKDAESFYSVTEKEIEIPMFGDKLIYDPVPKSGIITSKIGASKAISLGAYAYAIEKLDH